MLLKNQDVCPDFCSFYPLNHGRQAMTGIAGNVPIEDLGPFTLEQMVALTRAFYEQNDMASFSTWEARTVPLLQEVAAELSRYSTEDLRFKLIFTGALCQGRVLVTTKDQGSIEIYSKMHMSYPRIVVIGSGLRHQNFPERIPLGDTFGFFIQTAKGKVSFSIVMKCLEPVLLVNGKPLE